MIEVQIKFLLRAASWREYRVRIKMQRPLTHVFRVGQRKFLQLQQNLGFSGDQSDHASGTAARAIDDLTVKQGDAVTFPPMRVLSVFGTRPEAIKMAPVVKRLEAMVGIDSVICVTGQHRQMLDQVIALFELRVDTDLKVMTSGQTLTDVTTAVLQRLAPVLAEVKPDLVLVHGDTTTTLAASLACYYQHVRSLTSKQACALGISILPGQKRSIGRSRDVLQLSTSLRQNGLAKIY